MLHRGPAYRDDWVPLQYNPVMPLAENSSEKNKTAIKLIVVHPAHIIMLDIFWKHQNQEVKLPKPASSYHR